VSVNGGYQNGFNSQSNHDAGSKGATVGDLSKISELVDAKALAKLWKVPVSWVRNGTCERASDPIPCVRLGRYVRFDLRSEKLAAWLQRRKT